MTYGKSGPATTQASPSIHSLFDLLIVISATYLLAFSAALDGPLRAMASPNSFPMAIFTGMVCCTHTQSATALVLSFHRTPPSPILSNFALPLSFKSLLSNPTVTVDTPWKMPLCALFAKSCAIHKLLTFSVSNNKICLLYSHNQKIFL